MQSFEKFWLEHQEHYKAQALMDYEHQTAGAWFGTADIDTDDDFVLDIGSRIEVYGSSVADVVSKLCVALMAATYKRVSESKRYAWPSLRDEAVTRLKAGDTSFSFGGNQTISVQILDTKPSFLE